MQSTDIDHFLYIAFSKTLCLENIGNDIDTGEQVMFLFLFLLFKQG